MGGFVGENILITLFEKSSSFHHALEIIVLSLASLVFRPEGSALIVLEHTGGINVNHHYMSLTKRK